MEAETLGELRIFVLERFAALERALQLQAEEYERRLSALNHAHERAQEIAHTYVTLDKYEQFVVTNDEKVVIALERVNEKFEDYVKRYEQRQREVDTLIAAQETSTRIAKEFAAQAAQEAKDAAERSARKVSRNIGLLAVVLTIIIIVMNVIGIY